MNAQFVRLAAGESVDLAPPADWVPGSVAQDLVVAREPALQLGRALDYVMRYPYGCLEQTVSGAFPLLYAADLAERILPVFWRPAPTWRISCRPACCGCYPCSSPTAASRCGR